MEERGLTAQREVATGLEGSGDGQSMARSRRMVVRQMDKETGRQNQRLVQAAKPGPARERVGAVFLGLFNVILSVVVIFGKTRLLVLGGRCRSDEDGDEGIELRQNGSEEH